MNKTVTIIVVLFLMSFAVHAQDMYTVHPEDTGAALVNPAMGWTMHFYSNVSRNYGSKLAPWDTLDDFPGVSTVYLRLPWSYIEPVEGKFNLRAMRLPLAIHRWAGVSRIAQLNLPSTGSI